MSRPHKIDAAEIASYLEAHVLEVASATTADRTQRKRLLRKGGSTLIVDRRYLVEREPQVIYTGTDLEEAVRVYNSLS